MADDEELPVADDDERDPGEPSRPADADQTAIRTARMSAGATIIAAIITAVIGALALLLTAGGGDTGDFAGGQTAPPPAAQTAAPTPAATSSSPTVETEPWSGTLVLGPLGAGDKNLDLRPPAHVTTDTDNDLYITLPTPATLYALGNAYIAAWQDSGTLPTAVDCVRAIESASAAEVPLAKGTVVCVRTGEGRIARLTVTATPGNGIATATFDAVVWQAA